MSLIYADILVFVDLSQSALVCGLLCCILDVVKYMSFFAKIISG